MNCVENSVNTHHAANKLVLHILSEQCFGFKSFSLIVKRNPNTFDHVEPTNKNKYVWILTTRF